MTRDEQQGARIKPVTMWAVTGVFGIYDGVFYNVRDAKSLHCRALGKTWKYCIKKGDSLIRVKVSVVNYTKRKRK